MSKKVKKAKVYATEALKRAEKAVSKLTASAMLSLGEPYALPFLKGIRRSRLTRDGLRKLLPDKYDKMEYRLLKLLAGWSVHDMEYLLVHRVIPAAKRRATIPRKGSKEL